MNFKSKIVFSVCMFYKGVFCDISIKSVKYQTVSLFETYQCQDLTELNISLFLVDKSLVNEDCQISLDEFNSLLDRAENVEKLAKMSLLIDYRKCDEYEKIYTSLRNILLYHKIHHELFDIRFIIFVVNKESKYLGHPYHRLYVEGPPISISNIGFGEMSSDIYEKFQKDNSNFKNGDEVFFSQAFNVWDKYHTSNFNSFKNLLMSSINFLVINLAGLNIIKGIVSFTKEKFNKKSSITKETTHSFITFVVFFMLIVESGSEILSTRIVDQGYEVFWRNLNLISNYFIYIILIAKLAKLITSFQYSRHYQYLVYYSIFVVFVGISWFCAYALLRSDIKNAEYLLDILSYVLDFLVGFFTMWFIFLLYNFIKLIDIIKINSNLREGLKKFSNVMMAYALTWILHSALKIFFKFGAHLHLSIYAIGMFLDYSRLIINVLSTFYIISNTNLLNSEPKGEKITFRVGNNASDMINTYNK